MSDISQALQQSHPLILLAQKLTTTIKIKTVSEEYKEINCSFILFDQSHFIFKRDYLRQTAFQANNKNRADKLLDFFNMAWEQAQLEIDAKQIFI